jgi:GNAT superfamily N-acetyltransferase
LDVRVTPLAEIHDRAAFSSGKAAIDVYLHRAAMQAQNRRSASTFVAVAPLEPSRILGFFTLVAMEFRDDEMPENVARKLKVRGMRAIPGILLAQLAIQDSLRGRGFGKFLLAGALERCLRAATLAGAVPLVTDPIDAQAQTFYEKFGFERLRGSTPRMLLPMATVVDGASGGQA